MRRSTHLRAALFLLLGCLNTLLNGQDQGGIDPHAGFGDNRVIFHKFNVIGDPSGTFNSLRFFTSISLCQVADHPELQNGTDGLVYQPMFYYSLPGGSGPKTFQLDLEYSVLLSLIQPFGPGNMGEYQISSGNEVCGQAVKEILGSEPDGDYLRIREKVTITLNSGDAWSTGGMRKFRLYKYGIDFCDSFMVYFGGIMVGASYTGVIGHFDTPLAPLFILHDPPGDASSSTLSNTTSTCFGQTFSASADASANVWGKVKLGVEGSVGIGVETNYQIFGQGGIDLTMGQTQTSDREYKTCVDVVNTETTTATGLPDDLFIGQATRYKYGMAHVVTRQPVTLMPILTSQFAMEPEDILSSYKFTESEIRGTVLPQLAQQIAQLPEGSVARRDAVNQQSVWLQTLAMNESIKATAPLEQILLMSGGPGHGYSITSTTTESRSIEMSVYLDAGLNWEVNAELGGSGVSAGGEVRLRTEFGKGESSSNTTTNTMSYYLEDDDLGDMLSVEVRKDNVFGSYAFRLVPEVSRTSCPNEGGYQIDQPSLSVGTLGNSYMVLNEVPIGSGAAFPIYVCNNSDVDRTYYLKFRTESNTEGGVLNAFGNQINSNDDGLDLDIPAGECLNVSNLVLTEPGFPVGPDYTVEVYLYSLCEPGIRSSITIEAHFGVGNGNWAPVCIPAHSGESAGWQQFIDDVELGSLSNTGSGVSTADAFTDHPDGPYTELPRNSHQLLVVTNGLTYPEHYAAWIDWDQNNVFAESEKLGELVNDGSHTYGFPFVVPSDATLGTTRMRVRLVEPDGAPVPLDPCFNYYWGETEDYRVVITDNAPLDCQGVSDGAAWPGTSCDDGDPLTGDDRFTTSCTCIGSSIDCAGTPNGDALPGTPCDDGDANTASDSYTADCTCAGNLQDCIGQPGGTALPGSPCDDGDPTTGNDLYTASCECAGQVVDCVGQPGGAALPGTSCDDGDPLSSNDVYTLNCTCAGILVVDCQGIVGGPDQPGVPCDDSDPLTAYDVFGADCTCAGSLLDCAGTPGGLALPGSPCNDWNVQTINDVYAADCLCTGEMTDLDCQGIAGGQALPGTQCDDGQACSANDTWSTGCYCIGGPAFLVDLTSNLPVCQGSDITIVAHITDTVPGTTMYLWQGPGNFTYNSDVYDFVYLAGADPALVNGVWLVTASHNGCVGMPGLIDVEVTPDTDNDGLCDLEDNCPELTGQQGDACDDGDANTESDVITAACVCVGELSTGIISRTAPAASIRYDRANSTIFVSEVEPGPVVLFDATGQIVQTLFGQAVRFQVGALPSGLYVVRSANLAERLVVVH